MARTMASTEVKRAEFTSIEAQIDQLQNALSESERNLKDCQLFSSFSGQVAAVHVTPGGYVNRGQAVVTVQMMDPIKVDFEVSAATARRMNYNDIIPVTVELRDGESHELKRLLYMIDPTANPATRTFTATVLLRNQLTHSKVPADLANQPLARTEELARVIRNAPGFPGKLFVRVDAIQQDDEGPYVWKILNRNANTAVSDASPVLQVQKVRVTVGETRVPFLQLWTFADVSFPDNDSFNSEEDLLAGPVILPEDSAGPWQGETILYDRPRWLLRPGDLVSVDISGGQFPTGFYVPLDAIQESAGKYFIFTVQSSAEQGSQARRVEVRLRERLDTLQGVEAVGQPSLQPGTKVIAEGAHFLVDGEAVTIASETEVRR